MKNLIYSLLVIGVIACNKKENIIPNIQLKSNNTIQIDSSLYLILYRDNILIGIRYNSDSSKTSYGSMSTGAVTLINDSIDFRFGGFYQSTFVNSEFPILAVNNNTLIYRTLYPTKLDSQKGMVITNVYETKNISGGHYLKLCKGYYKTKLIYNSTIIDINLKFKCWLYQN